MPNVSSTQRDSFADTNGDGRADPGEQIDYDTVILNSGSTDAEGVTFTNSVPADTTLNPGSLTSTPVARNDHYASIGNVGIAVPDGSGVIANDLDYGTTGPTVVRPVPGTPTETALGGTVTFGLGGLGGFTYTPPVGFTGNDSFNYTLADETGAVLPAPATGANIAMVTIAVAEMIWFVDNGAAGSNAGTLENPYTSLAAFRAVNGAGGRNPGSGDCIFVYSDAALYTGGLTLLTDQTLVGQGTTQDVATACGIAAVPHSPLPVTGGAKPTIQNSGAVGVSLASGNTVRGLDVLTTSGDGIAGVAVGGLAISEVSVISTGGGVDLAGGTLTVSFYAISSSGADYGIRLVDTTGSFTITGDGGTTRNQSGGVIQNTSADGIFLQNARNITLNQVMIDDTANNGIHGQGVHNLTLNACVLEDNGNSADEAALAFNRDTGGADQNITGLLRLDHTDITRFLDIGLHIYQDTGMVTVEVVNASDFIDGAEFSGNIANSGFGIYIETEGSAGAALTVDGSHFDNIESNIVRFEGGGAAAQDVNVLNCTSTDGGGLDNFPNGGGIVLLVTDDRSLTFDIQGNDLRDLPGDGIVISGTAGSGAMEGRIGGPNVLAGNIIMQDPAVGVSDGINLVDGVSTISGGRKAWTILIQNNFLGVDRTGAVNHGLGDDGIQVRFGDNDVDYNLTIEDNTIASTGSEGIRVFLDDDVSGSPVLNMRVVDNAFINISPGFGEGAIELATRDPARACAHIAGNQNGSGGSPGMIMLDLRYSYDDQISQPSIASLSADNNGATVSVLSLFPLTSGGCRNPALPTNP